MRIIEIEQEPFHQLRYRSSGPGDIVRLIGLPFYRVKIDKLLSETRSILAASDLQSRETNEKLNKLLREAVSDELVLLQALEKIPKINLVFLTGDLYDYPNCRKLSVT